MRSVGLYMNHIELGGDDDERYVQFELAYPYIYIPMDDFVQIASMINQRYGNLCQLQFGKCHIKKSCDQIEKEAGGLNITVTDHAHNTFHLGLNMETMFLNSSYQKLP